MTMLVLLLPIVVHELGHAVAAAMLGLHPRPVVSWRRFAIRVEFRDELGPAGDLLIALAGPCASVMLAVPLLAAGQDDAAWFSVAIAVATLVPVRLLGIAQDGLRASNAVKELHS